MWGAWAETIPLWRLVGEVNLFLGSSYKQCLLLMTQRQHSQPQQEPPLMWRPHGWSLDQLWPRHLRAF